MRRPFRPTLIAALLAFHTAIMLCGPSLHAIPGLAHGSTASSLADSDADRGTLDLATSHGTGDACPICHLLAQGQLPIEAADLDSAPLAVAIATTAAPATSPASPRRSRTPRAPPIDAATGS